MLTLWRKQQMTARLSLAYRVLFAAGTTVVLTVLGLWAPHALMAQTGAVTFASDIAPIVFDNCVSCHRPGGPAPFSLLSYEDVKGRADRVADVVRRRYMPPWKPEPGHGDFVDSRRLSDAQINLVQQWVTSGAPLGDVARMPRTPSLNGQWQLGTPDVVLTMDRAFELNAGGDDVYRHFVIPIPISQRRFVSAWELRAENSPALHHATMEIDQTGTSRHLDHEDPAPGYEGLIAHTTMAPDGYFLDWAPGHNPYRAPDGMAFPIESNSDLVLMLHLRPTGRQESVRVSVGLYFTDTPPTRVPALVRLTRQDLEIPAGASRYEVTNTFRTPVDLDMFTVQPHAHNLAREVEGFALLPDGTRVPLVYIRDWDFNWQGVYRYAKPVSLPAGTTVTARWVYDNSEANARNPHRPPHTVLFGQRTSDEMAELWFQVVPRTAQDRVTLTRALQTHLRPENIKGYEMMLRAEPDNASLHDDVALLYARSGNLEGAGSHFAETIRIRNSASAHYNLGSVRLLQGRRQDAMVEFDRAIGLDPLYANAHRARGIILYREGRLEDAARAYERAIQLAPDDVSAHHNFGVLLQAQGKLEDAITHYQDALRLDSKHADSHYGLALAFKAQGNVAEAVRHYREALQSVPDWREVLMELAWLLATSTDPSTRNPEEAVLLAERVVRSAAVPSWQALDVSAVALASAQRFQEATERARRAIDLAVLAGNSDAARGIRERLRLYERSTDHR
jgi:tetratricopeptide (TPR) repeat protein/mono/diheme cytochrome c family protein